MDKTEKILMLAATFNNSTDEIEKKQLRDEIDNIISGLPVGSVKIDI